MSHIPALFIAFILSQGLPKPPMLAMNLGRACLSLLGCWSPGLHHPWSLMGSDKGFGRAEGGDPRFPRSSGHEQCPGSLGLGDEVLGCPLGPAWILSFPLWDAGAEEPYGPQCVPTRRHALLSPVALAGQSADRAGSPALPVSAASQPRCGAGPQWPSRPRPALQPGLHVRKPRPPAS